MMHVIDEQNIGSVVLATARRNPELLAIISDPVTLNYQQFSGLIICFANRMKERGIGSGSFVALNSASISVVAPAILACSLLGARWVAGYNAKLLPKELPVTHFLTDQPETGTNRISIDKKWYDISETNVSVENISLDEPFFFTATSGTTGAPKFVSFSRRTLLKRAISTRDDFQEGKTVFCALFLANAYPFITRFLSAFVNGATVLESRDPKIWDVCGVNHLYGSGAQVFKILGAKTLPRKFPSIPVSGS